MINYEIFAKITINYKTFAKNNLSSQPQPVLKILL